MLITQIDKIWCSCSFSLFFLLRIHLFAVWEDVLTKFSFQQFSILLDFFKTKVAFCTSIPLFKYYIPVIFLIILNIEITSHYISLKTLNYTALKHYISLKHWITPHHITPLLKHWITPHCITYTTLKTLRYIIFKTLHYTTLHYIHHS